MKRSSLGLLAFSLIFCACAPAPKRIASSQRDPKTEGPVDTGPKTSNPGKTNPDTPANPGELKAFEPLKWPAEQILPSFPQPSSMQDLFFLRESPQRLEAESSSFQHKTGRLDGNGWLAKKGEDKPEHMIFGPYVKNLPPGDNAAEFSMQRSGDALDTDEIATIDVYDSVGQQVLAEKKVLAKDLPKKDEFISIRLPFTLKSSNHSLETRVYWSGKSQLKIDWISIQRNQSSDELVLFSSLKGIVNRQQPRLFSYEGDALAEGPYTWLESLKFNFKEVKDKWEILAKYKSEVKGLLIYDPDVPDTINLATTLALSKRGLVASPGLAEILKNKPYDLPVLEDYRGRFANKIDVYNHLFDKYWSTLGHRLVIGLNPQAHLAALREYAVATETATIWLDPRDPNESKVLDRYLTALEKGSSYLGWWQEEESGIIRSSERGVVTIAGDWSSNLTFHSGLPREVAIKTPPAKPQIKNKIYVGFILSDGDNLQYIEHLMRKLWNNPDRGKVPMGWTMSPATVDAMPGALNFYHQSATEFDNLISGPSGFGYIYPNYWKDKEALKGFVTRTESYNRKAGLRVVTVWNTITGATNAESGQIYADHAPSLLGMTAQNTGGGLTIFGNKLPSMALSCNYCTNEKAMLDHIAKASEGWNRNEPRFVMIQAQPWTNVTPTTFLKVKQALNADYEVVRPDHFFMLLREAKGLKQN